MPHLTGEFRGVFEDSGIIDVLYTKAVNTSLKLAEDDDMDTKDLWRAYLQNLHESSGLSYREIAIRCDLDESRVARILEGNRKPSRDVLTLLLAFGYRTDREDTDQILTMAGYLPFGPSEQKEFRRGMRQYRAWIADTSLDYQP